MKIHPIIRALKAYFPHFDFGIAASAEWCSMTFNGEQLTIECSISGSDAATAARHMVAHLPETEFSMPGLLVADIAVVSMTEITDGFQLTMEALILDD